MPQLRRAFASLLESNIDLPVVVRRHYADDDEDHLMLNAATDVGGLLTDGLGDGIWIESSSAAPDLLNRTAFGTLQATRTRISKTEYISCPSCGRTLFDLVETTGMIRERTSQLKGVKIGIMGCIVNGPGEMADADYGLGRILSDAYPDQIQEIWKLYTGALAGGGSLLNLTPVQPPPLPPPGTTPTLIVPTPTPRPAPPAGP